MLFLPLNYRHIFHAGNFCDVFKHALLVPLVRGLQRKEKGFLFLDTHAGTGAYDLQAAPAGRTLEYAQGIGRIWGRISVPSELREYVELVRHFQAERAPVAGVALRHYPGSPRLAAMLLRPQDRLALSELHPDDFESLRAEFRGVRGVSLQRLDAYSALRAYLPPPERRALVLVDPPYEDPNEVARIHEGLGDALARFPSGTYAIWYPIKDRASAGAFKSLIGTLPLPPTLAVEFTIFANDPSDRLNGCGLIVLNPPWEIAEQLTAVANAVREALAVESGAQAQLEWFREES